jgi:T5orf172 domain
MSMKSILTAENERELADRYETFLRNSPKRLCHEYGISRRTLNNIIERVRRRRGGGTASAKPSAMFLYVVPSGDMVKIGITDDPERRWRQLKTMDRAVEPAIFVSDRTEHVEEIEKHLHWLLRRYRVREPGRGQEWFRVDRVRAAELARTLCGSFGATLDDLARPCA